MADKTLLPSSNYSEDLQHDALSEVSHILKNFKPKHPALNRVHAKLITSEEIETVITSYDRMHHRHNRS